MFWVGQKAINRDQFCPRCSTRFPIELCAVSVPAFPTTHIHPTRWYVCTKSLQSCPTLCYSMDCSPPSSSVHGILQARILEWVAIPLPRGSSRPRDRTCIFYVSCVSKLHLGAPLSLSLKLLSCVRLLRPHGLYPARLLCPWDSPGKNTGVGCHLYASIRLWDHLC